MFSVGDSVGVARRCRPEIEVVSQTVGSDDVTLWRRLGNAVLNLVSNMLLGIRLLHPESERNAGRGPDYSRQLVLDELRGIAAAPIAVLLETARRGRPR